MHQPLTPQRERYLLLTLAGIQFSHVLDFMIMMPLGPILIAAFGISTHEFGLLVASYSFSAALSGLLAATFVDRFERKRLLLVMFVLFGLATLACGLAPGYATLLVARSLAGAFGGVLGALVQTIVGDVIPFARRARASGVVSAAFSLSSVAGVPLSLWLAEYFQWRAPFVFIAVLVALFILIGARTLPELRRHISAEKHKHPFAAMFAVLSDPNHLRALLFSALLIFSGFTVIPYITIYAVGNVGIAQQDIPYIYLFGGAATLITARRIGRLADLRGKAGIYRLVATAALLPLLVVTHIGAAPLWLWLICTTAFFVLVSGRMVPAMAIIASAAQPKLRGTFMSLNATTQSLAMGLAATLSGFIITQDASGGIADYDMVGYVAMAANALAIWFVARIRMHGQQNVVPDVALK
ncbi:MAG: MFS transporter [Gallionellales bacterium RIFCSPLOWO2_12_FULL_59_22]|nr:MAG: MFS transporter [Gallionellales bacterium RIFCSPLOWO2_02_FULL_59_110]OGT05567.1 MAG: MFS transporter [Gallionellales bacterium RIFCSPLOWO2_02_58_13]OGT10149.1 MAG: MFS transporter [Gallionellales bacterium RIFCSPLOWO2_12_FULL_59_22]